MFLAKRFKRKPEVMDDNEFIRYLKKNKIAHTKDDYGKINVTGQLYVSGYKNVNVSCVVGFEQNLTVKDARSISFPNAKKIKAFNAPAAENIDIRSAVTSGSLDLPNVKNLDVRSMNKTGVMTAPLLENVCADSMSYASGLYIPEKMRRYFYDVKVSIMDDGLFIRHMNENNIPYETDKDGLITVKGPVNISGFKKIDLGKVKSFEQSFISVDTDEIILRNTVSMKYFEAKYAEKIYAQKIEKTGTLQLPRVKEFTGHENIVRTGIVNLASLQTAAFKSLQYADSIDISNAKYVMLPELIECPGEIRLSLEFVENTSAELPFSEFIGNRRNGFRDEAQKVYVRGIGTAGDTLARVRDEICAGNEILEEWNRHRTRAEEAKNAEVYDPKCYYLDKPFTSILPEREILRAQVRRPYVSLRP